MPDRELERFLQEFREEEAEIDIAEQVRRAKTKPRPKKKHSHRYDSPGAGPEGTWWGCECGKRIIGWNYDGQFYGFYPLVMRW